MKNEKGFFEKQFDLGTKLFESWPKNEREQFLIRGDRVQTNNDRVCPKKLIQK